MHEPYDPDDYSWQEEESIDRIRGTLDICECPNCHHKTMKFYRGDGFFACDECSFISDEELFYRLYLGFDTLES